MKRTSPLLAAALVLAGCTAQPHSGLQPALGSSSGAPLTVEEYRIVAAAVDTPAHFEFRDRIGAEVLTKRSSWRERPTTAQRAEADNQILKRFGYELVGDGITYELRKDGKGLLDKLYTLGPVTLTPDGEDFLFVAFDMRGQMTIQRNRRTDVWGGGDLSRHLNQPPVLVGNDLVTLERADSLGDETVAVWKGDRVVYTAKMPGPSPEPPIKGLTAWDDHWVLELQGGQVIIDGKSLNQDKKVDEIFFWRLIDGKPFYFFRKGDRIGLSYDGQVLPQQYDKVQHYLCCEPAAFNPSGNDAMIWFYALRDGAWHYVEAGVYR